MEAPSKPLRSQEQEQEQEQELEEDSSEASPGRSSEQLAEVVVWIPVVGVSNGQAVAHHLRAMDGGWEYPVTKAKAAEYLETYPGVDVESALRAARQWATDNPTKRKTPRGMTRFLNGWMARQQDRPSSGGGVRPEAPSPYRKLS